jgi:epoxyqueuosine reductase
MATHSSLTTADVQALAPAEGFGAVGIAPIDADLRSERFEAWLAAGYHADMGYLVRHAPQRREPAGLLDGARSVICLALSYRAAEDLSGDASIARYARGRDYHKVLKKRAARLMDRLREIDPEFEGREFVDVGPIAERSLAAAAGLGWIGRNGCLIAPGLGSYVVLCEIVCNVALEADAPPAGHCGDCDACVRACPTGALLGDGLLDARRCRSYLTIEHRGEIEAFLWPRMGDCVFGCDVCQDVCPHNKDAPAGDPELLRPREALGGLSIERLLTWSDADWDAATRGSAMRRARCEMFVRNAVLAAGNSARRELIEPLQQLARRQPNLAAVADWAVRQLGPQGA